MGVLWHGLQKVRLAGFEKVAFSLQKEVRLVNRFAELVIISIDIF